MLQPRSLGALALLGLLAGAAASADGRHQSGGYYSSAPQIRLGLDVIWGGYGYAPPRPPPVAWYPAYPVYPAYVAYPAYYPAYYPAHRYYDGGYGRGHRKHRHGPYRGADRDD